MDASLGRAASAAHGLPAGEIGLWGATVRVTPPADATFGRHGLTISRAFGDETGRVYVIEAESRDDRDTWAIALRGAARSDKSEPAT